MFRKKIKIKLDNFECNLLINGMNEFRNMLLAEDLPTEDVDELLLKLVDAYEKQGGQNYGKQNKDNLSTGWRL